MKLTGVNCLASMMAIFVMRYGHRGGWGWWILMIPLALVVIGAIVELTKMAMASRERKALIESGVDPDTVAKKAPTLR
jgi:uncharacterized membrane protein